MVRIMPRYSPLTAKESTSLRRASTSLVERKSWLSELRKQTSSLLHSGYKPCGLKSRCFSPQLLWARQGEKRTGTQNCGPQTCVPQNILLYLHRKILYLSCGLNVRKQTKDRTIKVLLIVATTNYTFSNRSNWIWRESYYSHWWRPWRPPS